MSHTTQQVPPPDQTSSSSNNTLKQVSDLTVRLSRIESLLLNHYKTPDNDHHDLPAAPAKEDNNSDLGTLNNPDPNPIQVVEAVVHRNPAPDEMSVASTEEFLPEILEEIQDLNSQALTIQQI